MQCKNNNFYANSMKKIAFLIFFSSLLFVGLAQNVGKQQVKSEQSGVRVLIETDYGNMVVLLYDATPKHRDNFLQLVSKGFYDGLLFHRVINKFMIQGGDPQSKNAKPGMPLGNGNLGYTIPAEFNDTLIHKKGALAAARMGDEVNPTKASSSCQFYIVQGEVMSPEMFPMMEKYLGHPLSDLQRKIYSTVGGTPHLDGAYTVFGEVIEGLDVIDKIAAVQCDPMSRPETDVKMKIKKID